MDWLSTRFHRPSRSTTAWLALLAWVSAAAPATAYNPESPEVRRLIDRGMGYLETAEHRRLGGKCLIALAFVKDDKPDHPKIAEALAACREAKSSGNPIDIYSNGIALILLCELDAKRHRGLIDFFLGRLQQAQKPHGGWGYRARKTGDTSQTQYGSLGLWEAHQNLVSINPAAVKKCLDWILATQDPSGAWGYQGKIGSPSDLVAQDEVRPSMAIAGLSSLLVCANLYDLLQPGAGAEPGSESYLPEGFRQAEDASKKRKARPLSSSGVNKKALFQSLKAGQRWMDNNFTISVTEWNSYYLYSMERYKSFEELLVAAPDPEPDWYNRGVDLLADTQKETGEWGGFHDEPEVHTAFCVLFLLRSTQKSLGKGLGEGIMLSGRGAPVALARKKGLNPGGLLAKEASTRVSDMLAMLDDDRAEQLDAIANDPTAFVAGPIDDKTARRLQQLVRGGAPSARLLAVKALGRTGKLDHAPTLLFALTDPDRKVALAARDGLRFLSRRFEGYGLPDNFTDRQLYEARDKWKNWYLTFRPDAVLDQ